MRRSATALLVLSASATPALAHAPVPGIGAFYNALLHPILVPAQLLVLVGIGLLLGQHAPRTSQIGWPVFAMGLVAGLVATFYRDAGTIQLVFVIQTVLLAIACLAGVLVLLDTPMGSAPGVVLAAFGGLAVGLDSGPDGVAAAERWIALVGTATGALLIVSYVGGIAAWLERPWQRIAVRVAGSWTCAIAAIVLAVELAGTRSA